MRSTLRHIPKIKKWFSRGTHDVTDDNNNDRECVSNDQEDETDYGFSVNQLAAQELEPHRPSSLKSKRSSVSTSSTISYSIYGKTEKESKCRRIWHCIKKFGGFLGPGIMVAVAYMDPGNYSTDVSSGAEFEYKMLFVILLSTIIALYLQTLAIRLGSVTGRDLAESCRLHCHKYVTWFLWIFAEGAILSTDVAEVAGFAIALKVLGNVPLIAGVFISIVDVFIIMAFYAREMGMTALRILEVFVTILLLVVVICFCVMLGLIPRESVRHVFHGFVPSNVLVSGSGIQSAAGILGATVMPHSLYLGSAQSINRVREHDVMNGYSAEKRGEKVEDYLPSNRAVKSTVTYAVVELFLALITVALFVNSSILIVAGDTLYNIPDVDSGNLFGLNDTLEKYLNKSAAQIFFVALLFSGLSAGIICTIAGQIVSEGHIKWRTSPLVRRIVTRIVTMIPCIVVVAALGESGISSALNWSQIVLTITLPFLATPLVYFTSRSSIMTTKISKYNSDGSEVASSKKDSDHSNGWISTGFGILVVIFLWVTNVYLLVQVGLTGESA